MFFAQDYYLCNLFYFFIFWQCFHFLVSSRWVFCPLCYGIYRLHQVPKLQCASRGISNHVLLLGNCSSSYVLLRSGLQITEKSDIWYERFLNALLVSFIARVNLIMRFSIPQSLADITATGFESWKIFAVLLLLNVKHSDLAWWFLALKYKDCFSLVPKPNLK